MTYNYGMQHILIVEDSAFFKKVLEKQLKQVFDFTIVTAGTFREAQKIIESGEYSFFVALLDTILPDATKGEIVDYVVSQNIPAIVITGQLNNTIRDRILSKPVVDYVVKQGFQTVEYVTDIIRRMIKNRKIKILAVDDSAMTRKQLFTLLSRYSFSVLEAENGIKALEVLREHPDIKVVITDYLMPEMDGFQLITEIRKKNDTNELAIIGISSDDSSDLSVMFLKKGANDFVTKPFSPEEFYHRIQQNVDMLGIISELKDLNDIKNKFIGIAAHDLRNPISSIKGFAQLMTAGIMGPLAEKQHDLMNKIVKNCDGMLYLVNDILDVSTIESGRLDLRVELYSINELIVEQVQNSRIIADKKEITLIEKLEEVKPFKFDPNRIGQVIDNLVSNAIKFSPQGSKVYIELKQNKNRISISVKDEGPGIPIEEQSRLFMDFQKLSNRPTGGEKSTGLGLAIVKRIVSAHKGHIIVNSTPGSGAEFQIVLPYTSEA